MPVEDRHNQQIHRKVRQRLFLDVCCPCDGAVDALIEKAAKVPVSTLALNKWRGNGNSPRVRV